MVNTPHSLAIAPDKDVPDTVRRLETEARFLRETLDKIDETLASVTSNAEVADLRVEQALLPRRN